MYKMAKFKNIFILCSLALVTIGLITLNNHVNLRNNNIKINYTTKVKEKKLTLHNNTLLTSIINPKDHWIHFIAGETKTAYNQMTRKDNKSTKETIYFEKNIINLKRPDREKNRFRAVTSSNVTKEDSFGTVKGSSTQYVPLESDASSNRQNLLPPLLDRRKRYLIFPESSSFQLIFDLIIGVVDYTKFAILGITVAVAWELPSKPPSDIITDLRKRVKNGTFDFSHRNDSVDGIDILYRDVQENIDKTTSLNSKMNIEPTSNRYYYKDLLHSYIPQRSEGTKFYRSQQNQFYRQNGKYLNAAHSSFDNGQGIENREPFYNKTTYDNRSNGQKMKTPHWQKYSKYLPHRRFTYSSSTRSSEPPVYETLKVNPTDDRFNKKTAFRKHHIYPIYKKRRSKRHNVSDFQLKMDEIHAREHLFSRNKLYTKLEGAFKKAGHNGTACILRALCETGKNNQIHKSTEPQGFIQEILRAVFTLPTTHGRRKRNVNAMRKGSKYGHDYSTNIIKQDYLEAYTLNTDCSTTFEYCSHSIWNNP